MPIWPKKRTKCETFGRRNQTFYWRKRALKKGDYISTDAFARLANISPQAARAIARKALSGAAWRGKTLSVAVTTGKGGSSGKRYLIDRTSLPEEINSTLIVDNNSLKSPSIDTNHRLTLVLRIMASGKRGSAERAQCIREIARKFPKSHDRQSSGVSERTLRGWVSSYEKEGLCGLHRGHRADRGSSRVVAWRAWDRAMTEAGVCQEVGRLACHPLPGHLAVQYRQPQLGTDHRHRPERY